MLFQQFEINKLYKRSRPFERQNYITVMEIMEDGNLLDRVRILLQRDMQYYQVSLTHPPIIIFSKLYQFQRCTALVNLHNDRALKYKSTKYKCQFCGCLMRAYHSKFSFHFLYY